MEGFVTVFDEQVDNALFWLSDHAAFVFDGARAVLEGLYDGVLWLLMLAPFWAVAALAGLVAWRVLGLGAGIASGLALAFCWAMGLWPETMQTLALVIAAFSVWLWTRPRLPTPRADAARFYQRGTDALREGAYQSAAAARGRRLRRCARLA